MFLILILCADGFSVSVQSSRSKSRVDVVRRNDEHVTTNVLLHSLEENTNDKEIV